MMACDYDDLAATHDHSAADGELDYGLMLTDPAANDPMVFCRSQATAGVALLTRRFGIRGYATSVHTACASGGQALGTALKLIRRGAVDYALAGGFDSMISPVGIAGFCLLSALSPDNDTPQRASRPFDVDAQRLPAGRRRRLRRARGMGGGTRAAARASTPSLPATATRCRATGSPTRRPTATARSRRCARRSPTRAPRPADVDYLNAHGTSTPMNDRSESAAIARGVRRAMSTSVSVSSTKSTMGHLIAAAGAVEVAVCALAIHHGEMPINANLVERDPDCDLNLVAGRAARQRVRDDDVQFVRLRRLEQLRRAAPSGRGRRRRRARPLRRRKRR